MDKVTFTDTRLECGEWQSEAKNEHGDVGYGCDRREAYEAMVRAKYKRQREEN